MAMLTYLFFREIKYALSIYLFETVRQGAGAIGALLTLVTFHGIYFLRLGV